MTKKQARPGILSPQPTQQQYQLVPPQPVPFYPPQSQGPRSSYEIHIGVMTDPDATVATATLSADGYGPALLTKTGSSKRTPADDYDTETGTAYAIARALRRIAGTLEKQAGGRVKQADEIRRHRRSRTMSRVKAPESSLPPQLASLIRTHLNHGDGDIKVHMIPLRPGDSLPPEFYEEMSKAYPGVEFTSEPYPFSDEAIETLGGEVGKLVDAFLEHPEDGVQVPRPKGKHRKEKNDD